MAAQTSRFGGTDLDRRSRAKTDGVRRLFAVIACIYAVGTSPAAADEPGVAGQVYGATIDPGVTELETRYGRLTGGGEDG